MKKPNSYDETKVGGEYTPIEVGGHRLVIKKVEETTSKAGKPMLKVYVDTTSDDVQPAFFMNEFKNDIRPEKKWPNGGTIYIMVEDSEGKTSRKFKQFVTSAERSNEFEAQWGDGFADQFKDKYIGGVYGKVENEYNGKTFMRHELRWFCSLENAANAAIPEPKYLNNGSSAPASGDNGFVSVPEESVEDLPF